MAAMRCYAPAHLESLNMKNYATIFVLLLCTAASAQAPIAADDGKVRLAVAVLDEHGTPIRDLTDKDFMIESHGKTEAGHVERVASSVSTELSPGEFTNREQIAKGCGLIVMVLDTIHTRWMDEKDLRPDIVKYLRSCASRNEPVSLLVMNPQGLLRSVHDYTTGSTILTAALDRIEADAHGRPTGVDTSPAVISEASRLTNFLKGTIANYTVQTQPLRASPEPVLRMFRAVAGATAGIPGRKSLVW